MLLCALIASACLGGQALAGDARTGSDEGKASTNASAVVPPTHSDTAAGWRRLWRSRAAGSPLAGPPVALQDGWVAAAANGRIAALDRRGAVRWSRAFTNIAVVGSPAVTGSNVVIAGSDGKVAAMDAQTGAVAWQTDTGTTALHGPLALRVGKTWTVVLLSNADGVLRCLDAATGQPVWQSDPTNRSDGPPATDGRLIAYGNCDSAVHVFDAETGKKRTSVPVGEESQMAGGVAILDRRVYGGTRAGNLVCVDADTEKIAWQARVCAGEAFVTPVAQGDAVVMGTSDGAVAAFDARSGKERWRASVSNTVTALAIADDTVFAAAGGTLAGLRLSDGARIAFLSIGDRIEGPAVNGRVLAAGGDGGEVIALSGERTGKGQP